MVSTATVLITIDEVVAIAKSGEKDIALRLTHQIFDTRVSAAMNAARRNGDAVILRGEDWDGLYNEVFDSDVYRLVDAIEHHIYPTAHEVLRVFPVATASDKGQFWVHFVDGRSERRSDIVLTYVPAAE